MVDVVIVGAKAQSVRAHTRHARQITFTAHHCTLQLLSTYSHWPIGIVASHMLDVDHATFGSVQYAFGQFTIGKVERWPNVLCV